MVNLKGGQAVTCRAGRSTRLAFTLIELLVVISIVSLLVAILLPALSKARDQATRIQCLSNVRGNMFGVIGYTGDNDGLIPDSAGPAAGFHNNRMTSPGGIAAAGAGLPSGLGHLPYGGYLSALSSLYCPARTPQAHYSADPNRIKILGYATTGGFIQRVNAGTIDNNFSYAYRGVRNSRGHKPTFMAHGPRSDLNGGYPYSPYLTSLDTFPFDPSRISRPPTFLAMVSDDFSYGKADIPPQGEFHHVVGYNVAFTDGHARWAPDRDRQVILAGYGVSVPAGHSLEGVFKGLFDGGASHLQALELRAEDIWDAFDGDIGACTYNMINGLYE